jgi:ABC-2 type transport system permease protein
MTGAGWTKYGAFVRIAAARGRRERGELFGRAAFFAVILGVFSSLWRVVGESGMPLAADPDALVWYLAVTEWILLSAPPLHLQIEASIRRGDVACQLGRPVSFPLTAFAEGVGLLATRAPLLGVTAVVCAFVFTGSVPSLTRLALAVPFAMAAAALITAMYVAIGILAFWIDEVSPVFWVWQKLLFILGGLMLPLDLYPRPVQQVAHLTPFPALLAGPASFMLHAGRIEPGRLACTLLVWSAAIGFGVRWLFHRATLRLTVNAG